MPPEFKFISKDDDSYKSHMVPMDWDVVVGKVHYQIVKIKGYVHCIGGHLDYGDGNDYWAYPLGEEPSYENLIEFNGHPGATWGIEYYPTNYIKNKWDETEIRKGRHLLITRNGDPFMTGFITIHEALAYVLDGKLDEHPLDLNTRDYDKKCVGRKVWWRSEPGIITELVNGRACVRIKPDGIEKFTKPAEYKDSFIFNDEDGYIFTSIFDDHIYWFRDDPEESSGGTHITERR